ncbi:SOS response-associated peptidase [Tessaracoccus caeni]|uniref:SOS response-associated peptidase n=1 Tax=Tessaracoccus caeni TaxID=3031239 RepID=UPI0023DA4C3F|nr:SOS response-associated peptidase [Tessaracoccus caeni]MDF1489074.1 SOS response-associated peptidase [Tessaracoccus caeni]
MCGRYGIDATADDLAELFGVEVIGEPPPLPMPEARPTDVVPVVLESPKQPGWRLEGARWDLARPGQKELKRTGPPLINVRSETAVEKFGWAVQQRRCLIPATGYWEWTGPKGARQPYFFRDPSDDVIAFAGMYSWWRDPSKRDNDPSRWVLTTALLTMDAVENLADIHDRNPVMLPGDFWDEWLDPSTTGDQALVEAAVAASFDVAQELEFGPVSSTLL